MIRDNITFKHARQISRGICYKTFIGQFNLSFIIMWEIHTSKISSPTRKHPDFAAGPLGFSPHTMTAIFVRSLWPDKLRPKPEPGDLSNITTNTSLTPPSLPSHRFSYFFFALSKTPNFQNYYWKLMCKEKIQNNMIQQFLNEFWLWNINFFFLGVYLLY